jgi:hypothetical protein
MRLKLRMAAVLFASARVRRLERHEGRCVPDVSTATGDATDTQAAPDVGAAHRDATADLTTSDVPPSSCKTNTDCPTGSACYFQTGTACGRSSGVCVPRLTDICPRTRGGGCPCLGVASDSCPGGVGGSACQGDDTPTGCWWCSLSQ